MGKYDFKIEIKLFMPINNLKYLVTLKQIKLKYFILL